MSRTVTVELTDEEYARIEREAAATSRTPAEVMGAAVRQHSAWFDMGTPPEPDEEPPQYSGPITAAEVESAIRTTAERSAARTGESPDEVFADIRARLRATPTTTLSAEEVAAADARFRALFGSVDSGEPYSADNDRIDADLAREYGRGLDWDR
jgi:hypothetical protein